MRASWPSLASSVLLGGLAVGGCGGGASAARSASTSHARVSAYARAVNLRADDVPGITARLPEGFARVEQGVPVRPSCGGGGVVETAQTVHSPVFISSPAYEPPASAVPFQVVYSSVQLEQSAAGAKRDVAADRTRSVEQCVGRYANAAGGARGPLVDNRATIASLALPLASRSEGFAFSATTREHYKSAEPQSRRPNSLLARLGRAQTRGRGVALDQLGFAAGRCVITLIVEHAPEKPLAAEERRLLRLLHDRAQRHRL